MPENSRDPIRELQNFGTGGLSVDPLEPAAVRRLGDRRRAQRRASIVVAASAFAVIAAVIPVTIAVTGDDAKPPAPLVTPTPTPTPTPTGTPLGLGNIPEDFPLDKGAPDYTGDGGELLGPDPEVETAAPAVCQVDRLGEAAALGRLGFRSTGPEVADDRELRTFRTAAAAEAVMEAIRDELDGCTTWTGETVQHKVTPIDVDTGWESITFSDTDVPSAEGLALGGSVYQVTRVGTAILTVAHSGEVNADSAAQVARTTLTAGTRSVAPEMCEFTPDACGSAPSSSGAPRTFTYPHNSGMWVSSAATAKFLFGASEEFRTFIVGLIPAVDTTGCPEENPAAVVVERYSTAGYALGKAGSCGTLGSISVIWALRNGQWEEVLQTADEWSCSDLAAQGIPRAFVGGCFADQRYQPAGDFGPTSIDGVGLGMSEEEVEAAGGTVRVDELYGSGADDCRPVWLPGLNPKTDDPSGLLVPSRGVISLRSHGTMTTPEGITYGSSRAAVAEAYPAGSYHPGGSSWIVSLNDEVELTVYLTEYGVERMYLESPNQSCGLNPSPTVTAGHD